MKNYAISLTCIMFLFAHSFAFACDCATVHTLGFADSSKTIPADSKGVIWVGDLYEKNNDYSNLFQLLKITNEGAIPQEITISSLYHKNSRFGPHLLAPVDGFEVNGIYVFNANTHDYKYLEYDIAPNIHYQPSISVSVSPNNFYPIIDTSGDSSNDISADNSGFDESDGNGYNPEYMIDLTADFRIAIDNEQFKQTFSTMSLNNSCSSQFDGVGKNIRVSIPAYFSDWIPIMSFDVHVNNDPWEMRKSNCGESYNVKKDNVFSTTVFTLCRSVSAIVEEKEKSLTSPKMLKVYPIQSQDLSVDIAIGLKGHPPLVTFNETVTLTCD